MTFSLRVVRFKARIGAGSLFLRLLYKEPWFRVATLLILGIVVGVPILVLRTFPVTPRGVEPEIKISGLDWLQATALARRAIKLSPEMDVSKHVASWRLAIGNNPGSLEINRAYLSLLSNNDIRGEYWSDAVRTGAWLLKLSRTNRLDLELTCLALEHYDLDDLIVELVESYTEERSMIVNQSYLRALFDTRKADRFLSVWDSAQEGVREDQRLKLYRTALDLAFTSDDRFTDGQSLIDKAKVSPDTEEIGHRLELFVSHSRRDVETFQESFRVLVEHFHDSVFDHLAYWDLLWDTGHKDLARSEALSYLFVPKSQRLFEKTNHIGNQPK